MSPWAERNSRRCFLLCRSLSVCLFRSVSPFGLGTYCSLLSSLALALSYSHSCWLRGLSRIARELSPTRRYENRGVAKTRFSWTPPPYALLSWERETLLVYPPSMILYAVSAWIFHTGLCTTTNTLPLLWTLPPIPLLLPHFGSCRCWIYYIYRYIYMYIDRI